MDDAQQNGDATAPDTGNVMDRVLETFDGLADNATAAIGTGVSKIGAAGAGRPPPSPLFRVWLFSKAL